MGRKYIPIEERAIEEILQMIDDSYRRWNEIAENGSNDPFWEDGTGLNLTRNHILYYRSILENRIANEIPIGGQFSLFAEPTTNNFDRLLLPEVNKRLMRPLPPEVDNRLMVRGGKYEDRLKRHRTEADIKRLVWVEAGALRA